MTKANTLPAAPRPDKVPAVLTRREGPVLAVASGKGGVGKTWMSITLTHALARKGQRALLFDGDIGLANVDIQLGLIPKRDLSAVFEGVITLQGAAQRYETGGFDIIAGRSGSGGLGTLSPQRLAELHGDLRKLARSYDRVVLDLGAGIDRIVRQLASQAGTILVVTTEDPTALTDAYAFIKIMSGVKPDADLQVVVNMARTLRDGEKTYNTLLKACETFLKRTPRLAGVVRQDPKVREAIRAQMPILTRSPNTEAARDVEAIAVRLLAGPASPLGAPSSPGAPGASGSPGASGAPGP